MSTAAHSSRDDGTQWSREEINAWLEAQSPELQAACRRLGRQWLQEGKDIVVGFNILRYIWEREYQNRPAPAQQPRMTTESSAPGILGIFQDYMIARQNSRIYSNLANLDKLLAK